jgi:hypothetical protein
MRPLFWLLRRYKLVAGSELTGTPVRLDMNRKPQGLTGGSDEKQEIPHTKVDLRAEEQRRGLPNTKQSSNSVIYGSLNFLYHNLFFMFDVQVEPL